MIYNFTGSSGTGDGASPTSALVFDYKGNLYGVTQVGGTSFEGTGFEFTPNANGIWTEKVLDAAGNIYGTTNNGGAYGWGTVFELIAGANGAWTEQILYNFQCENDGASPIGSTPVLDSAGNLYGVASSCGVHDYGVVYELTPG